MAHAIIDGIGSGFKAEVTSENELKVVVNNTSGNSVNSQIPGVISVGNSSTDPILANGSFVGNWEEVKDYSIIYSNLRSDADSSQMGLSYEFSQDASSVDEEDLYTYSSGTYGKAISLQPSARYFRIRYTNGPVSQGLFRLQTIYRPNYGKPSSHRIDEPINDQNDAELTKAVITGKDAGGTYVNFNATNGGNFKVSMEEYEPEFFLGSPLPVRLYNSFTNGSIVGPAALDDSTFSTQTIEYGHHEIHSGRHFYLKDFTELAADGELSFEVTAPNSNRWPHLLFVINGTTETQIEIFEGATLSGGTSIIPINNNRNSDIASTLTINAGTVISGATPTSGTIISRSSLGLAGATPSRANKEGTVIRENELILKSGTTYLFNIINADSDNSNIIDYRASWYEHVDKITKF